MVTHEKEYSLPCSPYQELSDKQKTKIEIFENKHPQNVDDKRNTTTYEILQAILRISSP